ncbi:MAG: hypothetical protein MJE68_23800, partial [Proteobacteria bacterium]|nr:hypothetical protein [Pseudomonadota bacterium]
MKVSGAKMAENKIANEILSLFSQYNYKEYVQCLNDRDAVSIQYFERTVLGKSFWIDRRNCLKNNRLNENHILEIFGRYSGKDPDQLRAEVMTIIDEDVKLWQHTGTVYLHMNFLLFEEWRKMMALPTQPCDELMIFILSRIHCRHTVVYTRNRSWSTVSSPDPLDEQELHSICDLHLVYLGNNMFGELKRLPMQPAPKSKLPPLPIIKCKTKAIPAAPLDLSLHTGSTDSRIASSGTSMGTTDLRFNSSHLPDEQVSIPSHDIINSVYYDGVTNVAPLITINDPDDDAEPLPHVPDNDPSNSEPVEDNTDGENRYEKLQPKSLKIITHGYFLENHKGVDPIQLYTKIKECFEVPKLYDIVYNYLKNNFEEVDVKTAKDIVARAYHYDKVHRSINLDEYLTGLALKRKASVSVVKLNKDVIR